MAPIRVQFLPPDRWQDFEDLCRDLFAEEWGYPNTQKNGREGQPQQGVDVCGVLARDKTRAGVQCKGKDIYPPKLLTEEELREEVEKAKGFEPRISSFIVATTASRDEKIQQVARQITDENHAQGLFTVTVMGWEDIREALHRHPALLTRWGYGGAPAPMDGVVEMGFRARATRPYTQDRHDYALEILVRNVGQTVIREYHVDLEMPSRAIENPSSIPFYVEGRSSRATAFFRTASTDAPIYPGDEQVVMSIPYYVDWDVYDRWSNNRGGINRQVVRASLYREGFQPLAIEEEFRKLNEF